MKRAVLFTSGLALSGLMVVAGMSMQPAKAAEGASSAPPFLFLNVQAVFTDYKKFQTLSENLKAQLEAKEKQLMDMEQSIKAKNDSIMQLGNQADKDNAAKEMQELKFDYEKTRRDARQEFLATEANMYATATPKCTSWSNPTASSTTITLSSAFRSLIQRIRPLRTRSSRPSTAK